MAAMTGLDLMIGALIVILPSLLLIFFSRQQRSSTRRPTRAVFPPGPPAWPVLGHLPLLQTGCPHHTLATLSLSPCFGPIIGLRLGSRPAAVVSSAALAKDVLLTLDKDFASRPPYRFADSLYYGYHTSVIFSRYSPRSTMLRKICTLELFTTKRLHDLRSIRQQEMASLLHSLLQASSNGTRVVDVGKFIAGMVSDTTSRLLFSKMVSRSDVVPPQAASICTGGDSLMHLIKELEHETAPTLGDFIPWLKCMDVLRKRSMKRIHDRFDKIIDSILHERREAMRSTPADELPHDFLQVLLSKEISPSFHIGEDHEALQREKISTQEIKGIILDVLAAGIHTTSLTLEWAMAEVLRNPRCLHKLREEIDTVIGRGGKGDEQAQQLVNDEHLPKLPYLEKVVKEVLRLHPVAPLLLPRISSKACKVGDYVLPKGAHMFVNVWAIGRDEQVWENAGSFWPERFEGKLESVDVRGQNYELLPFGAGRRMCPGLRLGLAAVQSTLANLVHAFAWELPPGQQPLDMTERRGITSCKAAPLLAIPSPRSLPSLY